MPSSLKGWAFFGLSVLAVLIVFNMFILPMLPAGIAGFVKGAV